MVWYRCQTSWFCMWICSCLITFINVEKMVLSLLNCLGTLFEKQLTIDVYVYFWTLNSDPLIYMSIFMPVPHCLDFCNFVVNFEIRKSESSNFAFLSPKVFWLFWVPCISILLWGSAYQFLPPQKKKEPQMWIVFNL